ncbi:hypothetical protein CPC08DRAFT_712852 [Agrocybe pediades]|nr:hypothetical protein CPC08DRAFT_712852 [Agrocybe pediades]
MERWARRWVALGINDASRIIIVLRPAPSTFPSGRVIERIDSATSSIIIVPFITITNDNISFDYVTHSTPQPRLASPTQRQTGSSACATSPSFYDLVSCPISTIFANRDQGHPNTINLCQPARPSR